MNPINADDLEIPITVSIGVTNFEPADTFDTLYRRVDTALYQAKIHRNTIVVNENIIDK